MSPQPTEPPLTSLAHGGGCGCKIAPSVLRSILSEPGPGRVFADLLVGADTSDDAAVWRMSPTQALVATTDFFMPIVDDPYDFGRIAATNALSDVYAMGASPIFTLALVGMPINTLSVTTIRRILEGGRFVCNAAGVPIAGGHSIDSVEPIYGLVALGTAHPDEILTNGGAREGDVLILTKPLGVGIFSAAFKQGRLSQGDYATLVFSATQLNAVGAELGGRTGVHAMTDVTGFGLLGHAMEMAVASGLTLQIAWDQIPTWPGAVDLAKQGVRTGASERNWSSLSASVALADDFSDWRRDVVCDPQTSGGLLIAAAPEQADGVLELLRDRGFDQARRIGRAVAGPGGVELSRALPGA